MLIDCAGVRRGIEHTPKDQYCADRGVFIIENLCNLGNVLNQNNEMYFSSQYKNVLGKSYLNHLINC